MRKASEPNVRALLMGFTMYSWSQRFGYSMDGVVGKTNQDVTRKLAQNNCLSLDSSPRLGTILGILSLRGALKKKDLGRIEPWATTMRANSVDPAGVPRSEERRVGNEWVRTCSFRWSWYHRKKN